MSETQESIGRWAVESFGGNPGLTPRHCIRLLEEVVELCSAAGAPQYSIRAAVNTALDQCRSSPDHAKVSEEMADCEILLRTLAHRLGVDLQLVVDRKMAVNRHRQWKTYNDGTGYHIQGPAS